ncbi:MAG: L,D-transpeptidase [Sphingobium sp. 32-64-5]|nr:MAG: L,D-transpeptidase [Sphingobium sp. 32-64-5]
MLKGIYLSAKDGSSAAQMDGKQKAPAPQAKDSGGAAPTGAPSSHMAPTAAQTAQSVANRFRVKRVLSIDGPLRHGDFFWDDKNIPVGPVVITVDLKAQTLSVFRDGYEIGTAVIVYGATDKPSPLGVFPVMRKIADYHSRTYDNAPMPFTLWLTDDGVAIHGSDVQWGNATHGCIGVPTPFAKKLFAAVQPGDPVIITDGRMMQVN